MNIIFTYLLNLLLKPSLQILFLLTLILIWKYVYFVQVQSSILKNELCL
jgi:hypothetical protein